MKALNLVDEPWIPLLGRQSRVGLREALVRAHELPRIEHPSPLVAISLYRLLLAILHRALQGPKDAYEGADWFRKGRFDEDAVCAYLETYSERFWLFHPTQPFYQLAELEREEFCDPWTRLTAEYGSGNTSFLTNHALRAKNPPLPFDLTPAEAACRLLEFQSFALGGLMKRFVTSAPGAQAVQGALILADGCNLFEQLCLSLVPYPEADRKRDKPLWERPPYTRAQLDRPDGYKESLGGITSLYTWFARSVKLFEDQGRVREIAVAAGVTALEGLESLEPMFASTLDKEQKPRALSFRSGRGLWRDFHALLPEPKSLVRTSSRVTLQATDILRSTKNTAPAFRVYGISKDQAKVLGTHCESFVLPRLVTTDADVALFVRKRLEEVEKGREILRGAARIVAERLLTEGQRKPHKDDVSRLASTFPHELDYFPAVERRFFEMLSKLPEDQDEFDEQAAELGAAWRGDLARCCRESFSKTELAAGLNGLALKAAVDGRRLLEFKIRSELMEAN